MLALAHVVVILVAVLLVVRCTLIVLMHVTLHQQPQLQLKQLQLQRGLSIQINVTKIVTLNSMNVSHNVLVTQLAPKNAVTHIWIVSPIVTILQSRDTSVTASRPRMSGPYTGLIGHKNQYHGWVARGPDSGH